MSSSPPESVPAPADPPAGVGTDADGYPPPGAAGTRRRAGNAMERARAGILDGARRCLADAGPRGLTMAGVADRGGVARATVYNHFRDRGELVAGLVIDTLQRLAQLGEAEPDLAGALSAVGAAAAELPELRGAVACDPSVAALVTVPADTAPWRAAHAAVAGLLRRHTGQADDADVALAVRWVGSVAVAAPPPDAIEAEAAILAAGLVASAEGQGG